jgi:ribulose-5-phosphate 4-epimerase/fuculose-1-phosphate aldolase
MRKRGRIFRREKRDMADLIQQARIDLAAALRLAARYDYCEGVCNHFSYQIPGDAERFLINPHGTHWSLMRASDLLLTDGDGNVLEGDQPLETTAFCIHSEVHRRHPRARCVLHTHMVWATALTTLESGRLEPVTQNALRFFGDIAYDDDYNGVADNIEEGRRIAEGLGDKRILFMANHGVMAVSETIAEAFDDLYYLERACQVQVMAMQTGRSLKYVGDNMAQDVRDNIRGFAADYADKHFAALKAVLDHESPDYAT